MLRGVHNEADLLIVQSLSEKQLAELTPAEFAGVCSAYLCDRRLGVNVPTHPRLRAAWSAINRNLDFLLDMEAAHGIARTAQPYPGGMDAFMAWAGGADLEFVLAMSDVVVGDFISANRRLIDLLGQIIDIAPAEYLGETARQARDLVRRWEWL